MTKRSGFRGAGGGAAVIWAAALAIAGCAGPRVYTHPDVDLSFYKRVGVVPFQVGSGDPIGALNATGDFTTELLCLKAYEVAEPGDFTVMASKVAGGAEQLRNQPLRAQQLKALGDSAKVQAVFEGVVRNYEMMRIGQGTYPLVSIELRMVDTASGTLLWTSTRTRRGGPGFPIFGWGVVPTLSELTEKVCAELAREVPR